jgi:Cu/Ag efflux protein CusF
MYHAKHTIFLALALALLGGKALAQSVNGEVRKIDEAAGKITLKHGPNQVAGYAG